jgi:formylglycine-generating enzyme required for sulfatase activity
MTVLPVRVEDVRPEGAMEYALGNRHWLDAFTPPVERKLELLARSVKTHLGNDSDSTEGPRETDDNPPKTKVDVPPTRRPLWVWPSVVAGVLMLGLLAAWLGGVFKVKTPDGQARGKEDPDAKTETVLSRADATVAPMQIVKSIGMNLVLIPAGTFQMGSPDGTGEEVEHPQHEVRITWPFYLGVTEVTQAQYKAVMGNNPSYFSATGGGKVMVAGNHTGQHPVENVFWLDAVKYCNKLSEMEGRKPFYVINGETVLVPDWKAPGYRLPTEAEWEYACGGDPADLEEHAWFGGNSGSVTHAVGKKLTNRLGLHDMLGNVEEWCWDAYDEHYYKQSPRDDQTGPDAIEAASRVIRGGSWNSDPRGCRSAYRRGFTPDDRYSGLGFRLALVQ